jgi:predicted CopG family antitoxin
MAADPLTTIPVRESTRAELQRLKTGGQSYDEVIRAILEELEEQDPWFHEMEQRLADIHAGKVKLVPIETLYAKYPPSKVRRSGR